MDNGKRTYTIEKAAGLLSCHPETVRREIRNGRLKAAKVGRDYRISRLELVEYWQAAGGGELFEEEEMAEPERTEASDEISMIRALRIGPGAVGELGREGKIALMLQLRKEGLEFQKIADEMMRRGIKTSRGHQKWHKGSVHATLKKYLKEELYRKRRSR